MPQTIIPMLAYEDASAAIEFLERAFGFTEQREMRYTGPNSHEVSSRRLNRPLKRPHSHRA